MYDIQFSRELSSTYLSYLIFTFLSKFKISIQTIRNLLLDSYDIYSLDNSENEIMSMANDAKNIRKDQTTFTFFLKEFMSDASPIQRMETRSLPHQKNVLQNQTF